jgi:hypothetical protein
MLRKTIWKNVYPILAKFFAFTPPIRQGMQSRLQHIDPAQQSASVAQNEIAAPILYLFYSKINLFLQ